MVKILIIVYFFSLVDVSETSREFLGKFSKILEDVKILKIVHFCTHTASGRNIDWAIKLFRISAAKVLLFFELCKF